MKVRVLWPNVWSSQGKHLCGDVVELAEDEALLLLGKGAAERIGGRPRKKVKGDVEK